MTIEFQNGVAYNRWSKSKYREIYPSVKTWRTQKKQGPNCLPKHLKYLTAKLLMNKLVISQDERAEYMRTVQKYKRVYKLKIKVFEELLNFTSCN